MLFALQGAGRICTTDSYGKGRCYSGRCVTLNQQCHVEGNSYVGNPFSSCRSNECSSLLCQADGAPGTCYTFEATVQLTAGAKVLEADGSECEGGLQCLAGKCVASHLLNDNQQWIKGSFASCSSCSQVQRRTISCVEVNAQGVVYATSNDACSYGDYPYATRMCLNPELGCVHGQNGNNSRKPKALQLGASYPASFRVFFCVACLFCGWFSSLFHVFVAVVLLCWQIMRWTRSRARWPPISMH